MSKVARSVIVTIRMPKALVAAVDAASALEMERQPGLIVSRSSIINMLVTKALAAKPRASKRGA